MFISESFAKCESHCNARYKLTASLIKNVGLDASRINDEKISGMADYTSYAY